MHVRHIKKHGHCGVRTRTVRITYVLPEHRYVLKNKSKLVDCRTGLAVLIIDRKNEEFYPILYGIPNCNDGSTRQEAIE